jgi:SpoIID/LytB domain protein
MTRDQASAVAMFAMLVALACAAVAHQAAGDAPAAPISETSETDLESASTRTIAVRIGGNVVTLPLEVYVARVISAEGEPNAPDATQQALAVAIRTFAIVNARRHARDGFALCDTTHCQVLRASSPASRRATLASAGRILTYNGSPAEVFYSASCGGRSERASEIWPNANFPYLDSVADDVHGEDVPWSLTMSLRELQQALVSADVAAGRLTGLEVESRTVSGRAARVALTGMRPGTIAGDAFRAAIGTTTLRSTAFSLERQGDTIRFTGSGYGHGVGMCVIGAGRRARRGESAEQILAAYYPGLALEPVDTVTALAQASSTQAPDGARRLEDPEPVLPREEEKPAPKPSSAPPAVPTPASPPAPAPVVRLPSSTLPNSQGLQERAARARNHVAAALGVAPPTVVVELTESIDQFRRLTGRPWWAAAVPVSGRIFVAPTALTDPDRLDEVLRVAIAEQIMAPVLTGRPAWVIAGGAKYFSRDERVQPPTSRGRLVCPTEGDLTSAVSAVAQRSAADRAETCFARSLAHAGDWREVR